MRRIFHIPAHLDYVGKLRAADYMPVSSPSGAVLSVAELLALDSWDFFDVLHLHTVELATVSDLIGLRERLRLLGKALVLTVHDLAPNIERDRQAFREKTQLVIDYASAVITLTSVAADAVAARFGIRPSVIPHGFAIAPELQRSWPVGCGGFLVFGALRPNRDVLGVVHAWRLLPASRPPLQILLRSVGSADWQRSAAELAELQLASQHEPDMMVELREEVVPSAELVDRCQEATTLVLPYRTITHSGQLELARDMGLAVVAPDVPTLRAQIAETGGYHDANVWFPPHTLGEASAFAEYLQKAISPPRPARAACEKSLQFRRSEHERLIEQYRAAYISHWTQR